MSEAKLVGQPAKFVELCRALRAEGATQVTWGEFSATFAAAQPPRLDVDKLLASVMGEKPEQPARAEPLSAEDRLRAEFAEYEP